MQICPPDQHGGLGWLGHQRPRVTDSLPLPGKFSSWRPSYLAPTQVTKNRGLVHHKKEMIHNQKYWMDISRSDLPTSWEHFNCKTRTTDLHGTHVMGLLASEHLECGVWILFSGITSPDVKSECGNWWQRTNPWRWSMIHGRSQRSHPKPKI